MLLLSYDRKIQFWIIVSFVVLLDYDLRFEIIVVSYFDQINILNLNEFF